jgi:hypothetical protein
MQIRFDFASSYPRVISVLPDRKGEGSHAAARYGSSFHVSSEESSSGTSGLILALARQIVCSVRRLIKMESGKRVEGTLGG